MKTIKLKTSMIEEVASRENTTPEKFVSSICAISSGRRVCAHFLRYEGEYSIFSI